MSINLIGLDNTISFQRPLTRVVKQTIKIENPNSKPIAFKVKTTAPKLYCVRPNSDIIPPNETAEVQIMLQAAREEPPQGVRCKDKFLILSAEVRTSAEPVDLQEFWSYTETSNKATIYERKLRCVYSDAEETPAITTTTTTTTNDAPAPVAPVVAAAAVSNEKKETPIQTTAETKKSDEVAEKLKQMEQELKKYKKEVETLRESEPIVVEKIQVKTTGYPLSIIILFALLGLAVAYFLNNNNNN